MDAVATSIALPKELVEEIEAAAAEFDMPREVVVRAALRRFVRSERRWRDVQREGAERAAALGLRNEDDLEVFLDSLPD